MTRILALRLFVAKMVYISVLSKGKGLSSDLIPLNFEPLPVSLIISKHSASDPYSGFRVRVSIWSEILKRLKAMLAELFLSNIYFSLGFPPFKFESNVFIEFRQFSSKFHQNR